MATFAFPSSSLIELSVVYPKAVLSATFKVPCPAVIPLIVASVMLIILLACAVAPTFTPPVKLADVACNAESVADGLVTPMPTTPPE